MVAFGQAEEVEKAGIRAGNRVIKRVGKILAKSWKKLEKREKWQKNAKKALKIVFSGRKSFDTGL